MKLPGPLRDRYRAQKSLGSGSYGHVVLARDVQLGRDVAVKILRKAVEDEEAAARFHREARVTGGLTHPNVVKVYDHGVDESTGAAWILYEYIPGEDLRDVLEREGTVRPRKLARWGAALAEALDVAHRAGVVHRDIKPENVLLRDGRDPLLADFGVARASEGGGTIETAEGMILGTPAYLGPEIWYGEEPGPESDQFALGASLFEALLGRPAWGTKVPSQILARLDGWVPGTVSEQERARAPELIDALAQSMHPEPERRFPDMAAFAAALRECYPPGDSITFTGERHLPSTRMALPDRTMSTRTLRATRRYRWLSTLSAAVLLATGVGAWLTGRSAAPPLVPPGSAPAPVSRSVPDALELPEYRDLRKQFERLASELAHEDGSLDLSFREERYAHVARILPTLLDVRQDARWRRFLGAIEVWFEAAADGDPEAPALDSPEVRRFLGEELVPFVHLYLQDVTLLKEAAAHQLLTGGADLIGSGRLSLTELAERADAQAVALREVVADFSRRLSRRLYSRHCAVEGLMLLADMASGARVLGDHAFARMRAALDRSETCAHPYVLAAAGLKPFGIGRGGAAERCGDRIGLLRDLDHYLDAYLDQLPPLRRVTLVHRVLVSSFWTFETCAEAGDAAIEAWYRRLLERANRLVPEDPAAALGELNEAIGAYGLAQTILGVSSPAMERRMKDMQKLRDRARKLHSK